MTAKKNPVQAEPTKVEPAVTTPADNAETPADAVVETPIEEVVETPIEEVATPIEDVVVETPADAVVVETPKKEVVEETPKEEIKAVKTPNIEKKMDTIEKSPAKGKKAKVRFIIKHSMNVNGVTRTFKVDETAEVELHIASSLTSRRIAHLIG